MADNDEVVWRFSEQSRRYRREQRKSPPRLRLPLPISISMGDEKRGAYCHDIGADSFGISVVGPALRIGDEVELRMWVAGRKLDASAWVLRSDSTVGLRCPAARQIYKVLGGTVPLLS